MGVLSLGFRKNWKAKVGDQIVELTEIRSPLDVVVTVGDKQFQITDQQRTEIMPRVFLSLGMNAEKAADPSLLDKDYIRFAFEAPREIRIERLNRPRQ